MSISPSDNTSATAPGDPIERRSSRGLDLAWFLGIVGVALTVRVIYVLQLRASPWFEDHAMDPLFHHEWAKAFASGQPFLEGPYFRAPLYSWFLGTIYWIFGTGALVPRLVQASLGALNCGLLFLIGRYTFNRTVGVLAGLTAAGYWLFIYYEAELLSPVLIVFFNLLLLAGLLWTGAKHRPLLWLVNGVVLGLSAITRPDILLLAPVLAAWLLALHWPHWRRAAGYTLCLAAGCLLPILPITIHNYVVGHDRALIATYGGVNFYIGNSPGADGMSAVIPGDPVEWWPCYRAQVERAERALGRPLKASEVSQYYSQAAWQYIRSAPGPALELMLRKVGYFWSRWEISNNQDILFVTSTYTPVMRYLPLGFWLVGPLGFVGLLLSLGRPRELLPLWSIVLVYMLAAAAFFVTARYRFPAAAVLILLAAYAAYWFFAAVRRRRWLAVGLAALVLVGISLVVVRIPAGVDRAGVQGCRYAGFTLARAGKFAEAEQMLNTSLAREKQSGWPAFAGTWFTLGYAQLNQNKLDAARQSFARALEIDPNYPGARQNFAGVLSSQGRLPEAIAQYEALLQTDPDRPALRAAFGAALISSGRVDEGLPQIVGAVERDPNQTVLLVRTGRALLSQKRYADALRLLQAGAACRPDELQIVVPLAQLLASAPDLALRDARAAVRLAEHAVELTRGKDALALSAAAMAYASVGQKAQAVDAARRALELAQQAGQTSLAASLQRDLQRYESLTPP